jgi:hypothetical protein
MNNKDWPYPFSLEEALAHVGKPVHVQLVDTTNPPLQGHLYAIDPVTYTVFLNHLTNVPVSVYYPNTISYTLLMLLLLLLQKE